MGAEGELAEAAGDLSLDPGAVCPVALANYAILGYILGRGMGKTGLLVQILINGTNIVLSIWFALGLART
jgi:MATE family multidrug resistance protein